MNKASPRAGDTCHTCNWQSTWIHTKYNLQIGKEKKKKDNSKGLKAGWAIQKHTLRRSLWCTMFILNKKGRKQDWAEEGVELRCRPSKVWANLLWLRSDIVNVSCVRLTWPCSVRAGAPRNSVTLDKVVLWLILKELLPKAVCWPPPWRRVWLLCFQVYYFTKHILRAEKTYEKLFKLFTHQGHAN